MISCFIKQSSCSYFRAPAWVKLHLGGWTQLHSITATVHRTRSGFSCVQGSSTKWPSECSNTGTNSGQVVWYQENCGALCDTSYKCQHMCLKRGAPVFNWLNGSSDSTTVSQNCTPPAASPPSATTESDGYFSCRYELLARLLCCSLSQPITGATQPSRQLSIVHKILCGSFASHLLHLRLYIKSPSTRSHRLWVDGVVIHMMVNSWC